jgi:hypothetical protein
MRNELYQVAYSLGVNFLHNIPLRHNYAVMFDIDDTLLNSQTDKPIKPVIKLLGECNRLGLKVIIITARDSVYTMETIQDLARLHIYPVYPKRFNNSNIESLFYDYLYLRHEPVDNHNYFKSNVKQLIQEKDGIYTIMSVGDNILDIIGDYSGYCIKLPDRKDPRLFHKDGSGNMVVVK